MLPKVLLDRNEEKINKKKYKETQKAKARIARNIAKLEKAEAKAKEEAETAIYCIETGCGHIVTGIDCCPYHPMASITREKPIIVVTSIKMDTSTERRMLTEDESQDIIDKNQERLLKFTRCSKCFNVNCKCAQQISSGKLQKPNPGKVKKKYPLLPIAN